MITDELSMLGNCWTGSVVSARTPTSTITRFTTAASTGCLMKMSVNDFIESTWSGSAAVGCDGFGFRNDRDQHCIAQLERAGGGDLLAGNESVANHDLIAGQRFDLDRTLLRPGLAVLVLRDDEHEVAAGPFTQRAGRNCDGEARDAGRHLDANRCTRWRRKFRVWDLRADGRIARRRIDACIGRHDRCDDRVGAGGQHLNLVAGAQSGRDLLGDGEVDVCGVVDTLQARQVSPFAQVLPGMHVGDADECAERRTNRLAIDRRLDARDLRQRDVTRCARAVDFLCGDGALLAELRDARKLRLRELGLRFERLQLGLLDRDVERDEHRASLDDLTGLEQRHWRTVPGSSLRTLIERVATTVPIAVVTGLYSRCSAAAACTVSTGSG